VAKRSSDEGVAFWWVKLNKGGEGYFTGLGYWTRDLVFMRCQRTTVSDLTRVMVSRMRDSED
jgi:hypothetical protein